MRKYIFWLINLFSKNYHFEKELMKFDVINKNGRMYTGDCVDLNKLNQKAEKGLTLGGLDHDSSPSINLSTVSHKFNTFRKKDGWLLGKGHTLDTEHGRVLKTLLKKDMVIFRPRGYGDVDNNGTVSNYGVISFDAIPKSEDTFI